MKKSELPFKIVDNDVRICLKILGTHAPINTSIIQLFSIVWKPIWFKLFLHRDPQSHSELFPAHFTFHVRAGNIHQATTLALSARTAEAKEQEIIAIKTTLAKVSQIREMKLVPLKKSREHVTDVEGRTGGRDTLHDLFVLVCVVCLLAN